MSVINKATRINPVPDNLRLDHGLSEARAHVMHGDVAESQFALARGTFPKNSAASLIEHTQIHLAQCKCLEARTRLDEHRVRFADHLEGYLGNSQMLRDPSRLPECKKSFEAAIAKFRKDSQSMLGYAKLPTHSVWKAERDWNQGARRLLDRVMSVALTHRRCRRVLTRPCLSLKRFS